MESQLKRRGLVQTTAMASAWKSGSQPSAACSSRSMCSAGKWAPGAIFHRRAMNR